MNDLDRFEHDAPVTPTKEAMHYALASSEGRAYINWINGDTEERRKRSGLFAYQRRFVPQSE